MHVSGFVAALSVVAAFAGQFSQMRDPGVRNCLLLQQRSFWGRVKEAGTDSGELWLAAHEKTGVLRKYALMLLSL